jgi:hypothetical protein
MATGLKNFLLTMFQAHRMGLEEVFRVMMGTETDATPTMQAWRELGPYFDVGGFGTQA